jgi:glucokinase
LLFYEYFHGDNGAGMGAAHQTGWTGIVAKLLQQSGREAAVILAGDVGGTKTVLAVLEPGAAPGVVREATLPSREIDSLESAVEAFLLGAPRLAVSAACVGVAGPVIDGRCVATNLPWEIHERRIAAARTRPLRLVNDLEAACPRLCSPSPRTSSSPSRKASAKPGANMALIAAGTGLGQAAHGRAGGGYRVVPSEGGHADFAPKDETQIDLLRFLRAEFGHVSWERVLSGPGLHSVYTFLQMRAGHAAPEWLRARSAASRIPAQWWGRWDWPVAIPCA